MASWTKYKPLAWAKERKEHVKPEGFELFFWAVTKWEKKTNQKFIMSFLESTSLLSERAQVELWTTASWRRHLH